MSAFTPEELVYLEAHKDETRVSEIHWVYSVPIAFGILSTSARLWAKSSGRNGITLDDWLIVVATICLVGECAAGLGYGPPHGMGRHVIVVSPHDQSMVRKGDYVFSHFYDFALVFVKLGILAFYHRVFVVPLFRKVVIATTAFVIAWGIGITVTLILACRPIEAFWDTSVKATCLDLVHFTYFTNITNMVTDVWIFLMPVPVIWHLQLQTKKKLLLCFIFSIGIATCVVSAIRLTVVLGHGYADFTWSYVPLGAYSAFEPLGGILCTNLPIIWHMWRKQRKSEALLPGSSLFRSKHSSAVTPSSHESRRSRIARSLGLSTVDQTGTDSQARTMLDAEEGSSGFGESSTTNRERALFFGKVERIHTQTQEMAETDNRADSGSKRTRSASESGSSRGPRNPNLKKTVWEVRRKR
ncbi:hypothetical protein DPSP01_004023 [Paraphaeosphaeria sporulosa]|uniref:Rhodopsin domain-containing protein n=1 Tax=Paraphaeosphaeria sporulosa TaxID=1460663 RepID=A0A177CUM8_9PLEO|nr:uncharacterized protein CC84DRAFT_1084471 [Paraphaeosphaeria sporulosa]OAG10911.1 hypothetical protein CC84DRAFT_1084471 [Paraphaeosphaeria sporulosa]